MEKIQTPVYGKTFAITGELSRMAMPRKDFELLIQRLGGIYKGVNSQKVDFLVLGGDGYEHNHFIHINDENYISQKVQTHDVLLEEGVKQKFISEDEFWNEFLPDYTDKQIADLITEQRVINLSNRHPEEYQIVESDDLIACCGSYQKCSEVRDCVNTPEKRARCQYYQLHLKKGEIFFGTDTEYFDREKYKKLCDFFDEQPTKEKNEIQQIVYLFVCKKRKIEKVLMPVLPVYKKLKKSGLLNINISISDILYDMYKLNELNKYVPKEAINEYKKAHAGLKMEDGYLKAFCADWIDKNSSDVAKNLIKNYAYVSLPKSMFECYDQFFDRIIPKDFVFTLDKLYEFVVPPKYKGLYIKQK